MIELAKCAYSPLGKAFENQIKKFKIKEKKIKALGEHEKQLVKSSDEKGSLTHSNKRKFLKNLPIKE